MKRTHPPFQNNALTEASIEGNHNYSEFRNDHNQADNINACLKRIRISSTSPGELALISDLTHLCREISLHRLDENTWFTADNKVSLYNGNRILYNNKVVFNGFVFLCIAKTSTG